MQKHHTLLLILLVSLLASNLALAQQLAIQHDLLSENNKLLVQQVPPEPLLMAQQSPGVSGLGTVPHMSPVSVQPPPQVRNHEPLYTLTDQGDIKLVHTPSPGRLHLHATFEVTSADYFRGRYDGVGLINHKGEVDEVHFAPSLNATLEFLEDAGMLGNLNLVGGTANSLAKRPDGTRSNNIWYESNNYVGLVAALRSGVVAGLTYTAYISPNNEFPDSGELALAFQWSGTIGNSWRLNPHVKAAWPLNHDRVYVEGGIKPEVNLGMLLHVPMTISLPLVLGVGVSDYYGRGSDYTGYVKGGVVGNFSLKRYIPQSFGNWTLYAGVYATGREKALRDASHRYSRGRDDAGVFLVEGLVGLGFTY